MLLRPAVSGAEIQHLDTENLSIDRGRYGFDVLARADFRPGFIGVGFASRTSERTRVNGFQLRDDQLQIYPEGSEIMYRADAGTRWTMVQLRREELEQRALEILGRPLELPQRHALNFTVPTAVMTEVERVLAGIRDGVEANAGEDLGLGSRREMVVDSVVGALDSRPSSDGAARRALHADARMRIVQEARRRLWDRLDEPYSSARLCEALGLPERTVQLYFQQAVQMSPQRWHRIVRLNAANALLRNTSANRPSVTDVALQCGFDQLGRFASEYRRLFGERPSETLRGHARE